MFYREADGVSNLKRKASMINTDFLLTSLVVVLIPGTGVIYTLSTGLFQGAMGLDLFIRLDAERCNSSRRHVGVGATVRVDSRKPSLR